MHKQGIIDGNEMIKETNDSAHASTSPLVGLIAARALYYQYYYYY